MQEAERNACADLLAILRREGRQQSGLAPHLVPPDKATAYEIAGQVAERLARPVIGWKIAAFKADLQKVLRTDSPIYGRVHAPEITPSPASAVRAKLCSPIPEVEYQAVLGHDLPPRARPYTLPEVSEAVASLHPGIELAGCRFVHDAHFPPLTAILADGAGASSIVIGPAIEDWRSRDIAGQTVTLSRDGQVIRSGTAAEAIDHPLQPLLWLANELSRTGVGLYAGQTVSTGTLTGMLSPRAGQTFVADYGGFGCVTLAFS